MDLFGQPHRRRNPLTGSWVLVSPARTDRPWQGAEESPATPERPRYDPDCYLCPGNDRAGGTATNPDYDGTFVFTNDFPSLRVDVDESSWSPTPWIEAHGQAGTCRVLCFHPRHDLTLARMGAEGILPVVDLWCDQVEELSDRWAWVQVFENRGQAMGASNPHPHGQLWAMSRVPDEVEREDDSQRRSCEETGGNLLVDYADWEVAQQERIVEANDDWLAVVPFWALWPFETLLLPRRHVPRLTDLTGDERRSLARLLDVLTVRYDNLFEHPFPYSMGWHGAPGRDGGEAHWQLHAHFYPPLLRSATVRKWMVGFEMLGEPQRDLTAEEAAARLRDCSTTHYLDR